MALKKTAPRRPAAPAPSLMPVLLMALALPLFAAQPKAAEAADLSLKPSAESRPLKKGAPPEGAACKRAVFQAGAGSAAALRLTPPAEFPEEPPAELSDELLNGLTGEPPQESFPEAHLAQSGFAFVLSYYQKKFPGEPLVMSAERQDRLIAEYQRTKDPEALDRIMASLVKWLQSHVGSVLRSFSYFADVSARDDLLQHAFIEALKALERHDMETKRLFAYIKSYIRGELTKKLYEQRNLIKINRPSQNSSAGGGKSPSQTAGASDSEGAGSSAEKSNGGLPGRFKDSWIQILHLDRAVRAEEGGITFAEILEDPDILPMEDYVFYERDIKTLFELARKTPNLSGLELEILQGFEDGFGREEWERFCAEKSLSASKLINKKLKLFRKIRACAHSCGPNGMLSFL